MFDEILLQCIENINQERSVSGIYHLLTGKRSSQTMQDAKAYQLEAFFGIYKNLNREELTESIEHLAEEGWIQIDRQYAIISDKGLRRNRQSFHFQGMVYHQLVPVLEKRLLLLIQTMTNLMKGDRSFVPIIDDRNIQNWVRRVYVSKRQELKGSVSSLYEELASILSKCSSSEAYLFTYRLTGNGVIGFTYNQLSSELNMNKKDIHLYLQHVFHFLIKTVNTNPEDYPFLKLCSEGLAPSRLITESAKQTYHYVERGWSIDGIVKKRRLKRSTIQDHIVEVALVNPGFSIEPFVSVESQSLIVTMAESLQTNRLKDIFQGLNQEFTYFQIRLTLAHHQHYSKEGNLHGSIN